jgi:hypothetical protein
MLGGLLRGEKASNSSCLPKPSLAVSTKIIIKIVFNGMILGQFRAKGDAFKGFWGFPRLDGVHTGDEGRFSFNPFEVMRSGH